MTKPNRLPLRAIIAAAAAVSGWAEWQLFVSFAPAPADLLAPVTVALGVTGLLFVLAQYTLAAETARRGQSGQRGLAWVCGIAAAALMAISVAGTASWFETAYRQQITPVHQPTAAEQADAELAASLNQQRLASAAALDKQADDAYAKELWTKAADYRAQAEAIRAQITTNTNTTAEPAARAENATPAISQAPTISQATVAGGLLGRWLFWGVALLVDAIPVLAAILLAVPAQTATPHTQDPEPADQQPTDQPASQPTDQQPTNPPEKAPSPFRTNWKFERVPTSKPAPEPKPVPADALATLRHTIRTTGTMPSRSKAAEMGIGQNAYRRACETLKAQGVIEQPAPGKPYRVINRLEAVQ